MWEKKPAIIVARSWSLLALLQVFDGRFAVGWDCIVNGR